jgi:hypothetical protein
MSVQTASVTATAQLAKEGETVVIEYNHNNPSRKFVFYARNELGGFERVGNNVPGLKLYLNHPVPQEIALDFELGNYKKCTITHDYCLDFDYECDRDQPIPLRYFAIPGVSFTVR